MLNTTNKNLLVLALLFSTLSTVSTYAAEAAAEVKADDGADGAVNQDQRPLFIAGISATTTTHTAHLDRIATQLNKRDARRFLNHHSPYAVRKVNHEDEAIEYYYESFLTVAMRACSTGNHAPEFIKDLTNCRNWQPHRFEKLSPLYAILKPFSQRIEGRTSLDFAEVLVSNSALAQSINVSCHLPNNATETPLGRVMRRFLQHGENRLLNRIGSHADVNRPHIDGLFPLEYVVLPARTERDVIFRATLDKDKYKLRMEKLALFLGGMGALNVLTTIHNETKSCYDFADEQIQAALNSGWAQHCATNAISDANSLRNPIDKATIPVQPIVYADGDHPPGVALSRTPAA